jgi:hypothetical protein
LRVKPCIDQGTLNLQLLWWSDVLNVFGSVGFVNGLQVPHALQVAAGRAQVESVHLT